MAISEIIGLLVFGALGALIRDIFRYNKLILPHINKGAFYPGFLTSLIIGAVVGYFVDHSFITAFCAGYTGFSVLAKIMPNIQYDPNK